MAATNQAADVFLNPAGTFDRLVLFTETSIIVANPAAAALAGLGPASTPEQLTAVIGADATNLSYAAIKKVSTNLHGDALNVTWRDETRDRFTNIGLKDGAVRDQAWEKLRRRLGPAFQFSDVQFGVVRAALAPLVTVAVFAFITWALYMAATGLAEGEDADTSGRNAALKAVTVLVLDLLGPTGVVIVGGLITAIAVAWGVARIRKPPRMLTLKRR